MDLKRKAQEGALVPMKKPRQDVVAYGGQQSGALMQMGPPRTSSLLAPIMLLTGHEGDIFYSKFSPDGRILASAGFDRLLRHTGAVMMELQFSTDGSLIFSASTDKTIAVWDIDSGERLQKLKGHQTFVNCVGAARRGPQLLCSSSDDGTVKSMSESNVKSSCVHNGCICQRNIPAEKRIFEIDHEVSTSSGPGKSSLGFAGIEYGFAPHCVPPCRSGGACVVLRIEWAKPNMSYNIGQVTREDPDKADTGQDKWP